MNETFGMGRYPFEIPVEGAAPVPAVRIVGKNPGKTLVVTAGVHGDEYVAVQAVREALKEIREEELTGQIIFVPLVNSGGFYEGTCLFPEDGENLNRCFPGKREGSATWRTAFALEKHLYAEADFLLDLHGGGVFETMTPLVFFPVDAGKEIEEITRRAAKNLSLSYLVQSYAKDGLYSWAAQRGIPAMLVERGGGGTWNREEVAACRQNIYETMDFLGIRACGERSRKPREICSAQYEVAREKGYWYCFKRAGEAFAQGELLGEIRDAEDRSLQKVRALYDGVLLYFTHSLGVKPGVPLAAYGMLKED